MPGGQITGSSEIENYPGQGEVMTGMDLMASWPEQCQKFGLVKNKDKFNEAVEFFENSNLIIYDKAYPTILELQNRIKATLRRNPNIKNIFVDHTGKIQLLGKTREDIEIGHISAMLKKIARDYNIRVFLLQQLNRSLESGENKRPSLS